MAKNKKSIANLRPDLGKKFSKDYQPTNRRKASLFKMLADVIGEQEMEVSFTKEDFYNNGIIYLEDDFIHIDGFKIHGSPVSPNFGNWSFMKSRDKLDRHWERSVDDDVDILITHTPPKGILDISEDRDGKLEFCGCKALKRHVITRIKPKLMLFGHIHNSDDIINAGTMKLSICDTIFSNGSVVTDRRFGKLSSNGNIFEL